MTRRKATFVAAFYIVLATLSVFIVVPGIMLSDAPGATSMPPVIIAITSAILLPPCLFFGAIALLIATWAERRRLALAAVLTPIAVFVAHVASLVLLFTWCHGDASRFACHA